MTGRRALILPTLGRTDRDRRVRRDGTVSEQKVTVEDSMSAVHASRGRLAPPDEGLLSEVAILARLGELVFAGADNAPQADWPAMEGDYTLIRSHIANVVPGFDGFEGKIEKGRTLFLPNGPRDGRTFATETGKAMFTANVLEYPFIPHGRLLLQTLRSHDQYNTTVYGKDDRYRGIHGGRRVVLRATLKDIKKLGFVEDEIVDIVSEWRRPDRHRRGAPRRGVPRRRVRHPRGNAGGVLPGDERPRAAGFRGGCLGDPDLKSVIVRLEHRTERP